MTLSDEEKDKLRPLFEAWLAIQVRVKLSGRDRSLSAAENRAWLVLVSAARIGGPGAPPGWREWASGLGVELGFERLDPDELELL